MENDALHPALGDRPRRVLIKRTLAVCVQALWLVSDYVIIGGQDGAERRALQESSWKLYEESFDT